MKSIRIGTRGSALALAQATTVADTLRSTSPDYQTEIVTISTTGDRDKTTPLHLLGTDKAAFIRELETALTDDRIDIAVHSLKDLPAVLPANFSLAATLPRGRVDDVIFIKKSASNISEPTDENNQLSILPIGATVATDSLRRRCLLSYHRPDLQFVSMRGNVPTRVKKLRNATDFDATILAAIGLERLAIPFSKKSWQDENGIIAITLPPKKFIPSAGQATIGIETYKATNELQNILDKINHPTTFESVKIERAALATLGASCHTPIGIWVNSDKKHNLSQAHAILFSDDYLSTNTPPPPKTFQTTTINTNNIITDITKSLSADDPKK